MPHILVSGIGDLVEPVAEALRSQNCSVVVVGDATEVAAAAKDAGLRAFDGYVQLPARFGLLGDTAVDRIHHFVVDGIMARYPMMSAALPALRPGARITFTPAVLPAEVATDDDVDARAALLRVLARAVCGCRSSAPARPRRRSPSRCWVTARRRTTTCRSSPTAPTRTGASSCWA